jgi:putative cardiolipin synthase
MQSKNYCLLILLSLMVLGCASVPFEYPKTVSVYRQPANDTQLATVAREWRDEHGDKSGIIGLRYGIEALGARLRLMEVAQSTIDAQYFILKKDRAGASFVGKMLLAADRGVRVRLLLDDIFTPDADEGLSLLNSHPNIEVRLFNPVSRNAYRYWAFLVDFNCANRRMHNKSFTVDNSMSIVGGRNIGEEYFELKQDIVFDDYEVLAMGPTVEQVSAGFDLFWNSELAVPIEAFDLTVDPEELEEWRELMLAQIEEDSDSTYAQAVNSSLLLDIKAGRVEPVAAHAVMVTDVPQKLSSPVGDQEFMTLAEEVGRRLRAANEEIIIVSPYFIPQQRGTEVLEKIRAKGVRVIIVTNSLASTNHVPVHSGYSRYRKRLLQAGIELYETRPDSAGEVSEWGHQPEFATLHSKLAVIDRQTVFIGSLNFDPRSFQLNSEVGLFIDDDEIGNEMARSVLDELPAVAYRVELDERGKLRWVLEHDGTRRDFDKEPLTTWAQRAMVRFYRVLPIESQL